MPEAKNAIRLLHLEDSLQDARFIEDKLELDGLICDIVHVVDREGFKIALIEEPFDVILTDYNIPGYDGVSALTLALEKQPLTPVIMISGALGEEDAVQCLQRGATDYLLKQRLDRLPNAIRQALAKAEEQQGRLAAEEALRESEARFRQLAEHSSEVFWFIATNPERVVYVSPAVERVWERPVDWFYQNPRNWLDVIHTEDRDRVCQTFEATLAGHINRFETEYRIVLPDGAVRWMLASGTPIRNEADEVMRIGGFAKEITEQKAAEERIREQAELLDKARDAICVTDLEGRVTFWNKGAERLYGWTAAEAAGKNVSALLSSEREPENEQEVEQAIENEGEWTGEVRQTTKDGKKRIVESRLTLIVDRMGNPTSVLAINTDISEKKQLAANLLRRQRLESIGTLAGGIAHDLNNALAPILMAIDLLRQNYPEAKTLLETMEKSAVRGSEMVRQLLTFARGSEGAEGKRVIVDPLPLLKETGKMIESTFPKNIELRTDFAASLQTIRGDATQLHQVLLNLCVNARDAMPGGGALTLEAQNVDIDAAYARTNPDATPGSFVVWRVTDTGTGISPEICERIFEPFFSTKSPDSGTGLGLSTLIGIVKSHGGFVEVFSVPDEGSTFAVHLPATPASSVAAPTRVEPESTAPGRAW
ncbi:MAG: PAS domain S-box protein [Opitutales bacterium]